MYKPAQANHLTLFNVKYGRHQPALTLHYPLIEQHYPVFKNTWMRRGGRCLATYTGNLMTFSNAVTWNMVFCGFVVKTARTSDWWRISQLAQLRDIGVSHVTLYVRFSSRPVAEVLDELCEFVVPSLAEMR